MSQNFKLTLSAGGISISKDVSASKGEHFKKLNEAFIQSVREMETLLENPPKTEKETVIDKPIKEKKIKNAEDNS